MSRINLILFKTLLITSSDVDRRSLGFKDNKNRKKILWLSSHVNGLFFISVKDQRPSTKIKRETTIWRVNKNIWNANKTINIFYLVVVKTDICNFSIKHRDLEKLLSIYQDEDAKKGWVRTRVQLLQKVWANEVKKAGKGDPNITRLSQVHDVDFETLFTIVVPTMPNIYEVKASRRIQRRILRTD